MDEADADVIARQLKATLAIWNKESGHPKYGMLVRRLIKEHPQVARVLTTPCSGSRSAKRWFTADELADSGAGGPPFAAACRRISVDANWPIWNDEGSPRRVEVPQ